MAVAEKAGSSEKLQAQLHLEQTNSDSKLIKICTPPWLLKVQFPPIMHYLQRHTSVLKQTEFCPECIWSLIFNPQTESLFSAAISAEHLALNKRVLEPGDQLVYDINICWVTNILSHLAMCHTRLGMCIS